MTRPSKKPEVDFGTRIARLAAHPLRRKILKMVSESGAEGLSPNQCFKRIDEGLSQISYHFKVLREGEAIKKFKDVPRRGAVEHYHRIAPLGKTVLALFPPE